MIKFDNVSYRYPFQKTWAVKNLNLEALPGKVLLVTGVSGCGKTTMTRLFNGLIPHYHEGTYTGSVYLDGKDTRDLSLFDISLKVGSVFQNPRSQFFNVTRPANWLLAQRITA